MFRRKLKTEIGYPYPLGATPDQDGVNFSLFSKNATRVWLCLFNGFGHEIHCIEMKDKTGDVWHVYVVGLKAGQRYGFRVDGAWAPEEGLRFNRYKLLLDPAARLLTKNIEMHPSQFAYRLGASDADLSFNKTDSAPFMPKCIVTDLHQLDDDLTYGRPHTPWDETVIYEAHLKGFTILNPKVPFDWRGHFMGLSAKKVVQYLKSLGITTLELLPTAAFVNPLFLKQKGLSNYWGYDPVCFKAPQPSYLKARDLRGIQTMVRVLHEAGIEVVLDVVYNHTGEGSELGPSLCFKGIDNPTYYRLSPKNKRYYMNDTGCGNMLNFDSPATLELVLNAMRYWVEVFGIDGFRFDLATTLGRTGEGGFCKDAPFFKAVSEDNMLKNVKLIAEPWDIGWGGYQLGQFPSAFAEWNDKFRDACRRFWRGDIGQAGALFQQFTDAQYDHKIEKTNRWKKINFLTAHDGFTGADLVSYNDKHNAANGEDNRDGNANNWSWNSGVEGQTKDPSVLALRLQRLKAMMATLLLSNGVPMMLAGDEFLNTQFGNNNAYAQDNETAWLNWSKISPAGKQMQSFIADVLKMRREHTLFAGEFWVCLQDKNGIPLDVHNLCEGVRDFAFVCQSLGNTYFIIMNATDASVLYRLKKDTSYTALLDTSNQSRFVGADLSVGAWSMVVLKED